MEIPVQITFRDIPHSMAIEEKVQEYADRLDRLFDRIIRCRVVVEAPHRHHHKGKIYHVTIDLKVPGNEIVVSKDGQENHKHEDVYVAIHDAFQVAERQLEDYIRKMRGN